MSGGRGRDVGCRAVRTAAWRTVFMRTAAKRAAALAVALGVTASALSAQRVNRLPQGGPPAPAPGADRAQVPVVTPRGTAAVEGTVADSTGAPVAEARVTADATDFVVFTDREGRFVLSDLPVGDHVVRVAREGFEPLMFKLALPAPATVSVKLTLLPRQGPPDDSERKSRAGALSSIVGLVTDQYDVPIRLAQVTAMGTPVSTLTDSAGRFRMERLALGPYFLRVRKVGFGPVTLTVQLKTTDSADVHIRLDSRAANVLATTTVTAEAERGGPRLRGFYERKGKASGFFFEAEEIARRRPPQLTDLFRSVPSLTVERDGSGRQVVLGRLIGTRRCAMALIVDGVFIKDGNAMGALDGLAPPDQVRAVEVYTSNVNVPGEFARPGTECGAVVVWTK